ncbi:MAG: DUF1003 domain-containing protein [Micromonosporaceae bacterium]|nr:DUF1003 domain-containing protein [Micromonosporaceae bacterium]
MPGALGGSADRSRGSADRNRLDQPREPRRLRLPHVTGETFGHFAEAFARFMGTAKFLAYMTIFVLVWIGLNIVGLFGLRWDPYPFILLNLFFSTQASYAAPLILLAQNRQADRDRLTMDQDRRQAAMQKADTEYLAREIASLRIALGEVATRDFLRAELGRLVEELDEAARRQRKQDRRQHHPKGKRADRGADAQELTEPYDSDLDGDVGERDDGSATRERERPDGSGPREHTPRASRG